MVAWFDGDDPWIRDLAAFRPAFDVLTRTTGDLPWLLKRGSGHHYSSGSGETPTTDSCYPPESAMFGRGTSGFDSGPATLLILVYVDLVTRDSG